MCWSSSLIVRTKPDGFFGRDRMGGDPDDGLDVLRCGRVYVTIPVKFASQVSCHIAKSPAWIFRRDPRSSGPGATLFARVPISECRAMSPIFQPRACSFLQGPLRVTLFRVAISGDILERARKAALQSVVHAADWQSPGRMHPTSSKDHSAPVLEWEA